MGRLPKLPGWVVTNQESVRRETDPYREMTPERRLALGAAASRSAMRIVLDRPDRATILGYRDPLPESSQQALARLRARWRSVRP